MKGKKNLERAIILGLILSTGVYGSAWADSIRDSIINSDVNININNDSPAQAAVIQDKNKDIILSTESINEQYQHNITINSKGSGIHIKNNTEGSVVLTAKDNTIKFGSGESEGHGITIEGSGYVKITANGNNIIQSNKDSNGDGINLSKDSKDSSGLLVVLTAGNSNKIEVSGNDSDGIYTDTGSKKSILLTAYAEDNGTSSGNIIEAGNNGIDHKGNNSIRLSVGNNGEFTGINKITAKRGNGVRTDKGSGNVTLEAGSNEINSGDNGIQSDGKGTIDIKAYTKNNKIEGYNNGVYATNGIVNVIAYAGSNILGARISEFEESDYGEQNAISAYKGTNVNVEAKNENLILGAVYATGDLDKDNKGDEKPAYGTGSTAVEIKGSNGSKANNYIYSAAVIDGAGDLVGKTTIKNPETGEEEVTGLDVVSALYAEKGAVINVSGINDFRTYYSKPSDEYTSERVVWAYDTADINIDGYTNISTTLYKESPNSKDIAIAAGTAIGLSEQLVNAPVKDRATVTLTYDNFKTNDGKEVMSNITGDILSAYAGKVDITAAENSDAGINITGNLLAGNNGILNVDLGKGGKLTGRADDYGDAGVIDNSEHLTVDDGKGNKFFDPAFSSDIFKGGEVNLTMGEGSSWEVTGQSWITRINTNDTDENVENNAFIDLVSANTDRNTSAHALTVYEMNGNATFNMSLDRNRNTSDMLYIKNAQGDYIVNVVDAVTTADMYADGFEGLRFATVGTGSNATFRAVTVDKGVLNVEYEVDTDTYNNNTENDAYNGSVMSEHKPGSDLVDGLFENNGEPGSTTKAAEDAVNNIMLLDENTMDDKAVTDSSLKETTNFKLVARKGEELSDGGKTILNMSRANYSNAIYMDRLNKRLGEARYINSEEDEGMWVRIRHDRIGKDDAYRSQNTMYELGYDQKQECDNGKRRVGMAIDYMHGDTGYDQIAGKGEIDRYGLWLYDTWMGDKGHYADYVAKWGHLDNEFEIYAPTTGEKINGDYSNNVFSVSAEYGRKKDIGNDWYFEPQVQAQLARVTGADYTTSQGTKVSVDGINSLIGRAGFRLGKDFGEEKQSTVYIKADVLHEFFGDQDIKAMDATTNGNWSKISYENEGTWYDVGFGFATQMSKNSYAFMDFEKSFGNDNDETYQINVGMQWSF